MATILIIQDESTSLICKTMLGGQHQILEASNSDVGLKLFRDCHPRLVIVDLLIENSRGIVPTHQGALELLSIMNIANKTTLIIVYSVLCFEPYLRKQIIVPKNVLVNASLTKDAPIEYLKEAALNYLKLL
jgi:hypothetical protein